MVRRSSGAPVTPIRPVCVFGLLRRGLHGDMTADDERAERVKELLAAPAPAGALESRKFGRFLDPFLPCASSFQAQLGEGAGRLRLRRKQCTLPLEPGTGSAGKGGVGRPGDRRNRYLSTKQ